MLKRLHTFECESYDFLLQLYNSYVAKLESMESSHKDYSDLVTIRNLTKNLCDDSFQASKKAFDESSLFYKQFGTGTSSGSMSKT